MRCFMPSEGVNHRGIFDRIIPAFTGPDIIRIAANDALVQWLRMQSGMICMTSNLM